MPHEHCLGPLPKAYNLDQLTMAFGDWLKSNMTSIPELAGVVLDTALMFALYGGILWTSSRSLFHAWPTSLSRAHSGSQSGAQPFSLPVGKRGFDLVQRFLFGKREF